MSKNKGKIVKVVTYFENKQSITQAFGQVILNNIKTKAQENLLKVADKEYNENKTVDFAEGE